MVANYIYKKRLAPIHHKLFTCPTNPTEKNSSLYSYHEVSTYFSCRCPCDLCCCRGSCSRTTSTSPRSIGKSFFSINWVYLLKFVKNQLRRVLLRSEILKKAEQLQAIAYASPQRNRAVFTPGHKATTDWIFAQFQALSDYYTVKYHEFTTSTSIAGVTIPGSYFLGTGAVFGPLGKVTAEVVAIPNLGCDAVRDFFSLRYLFLLTNLG